jgi:hypothetical protein
MVKRRVSITVEIHLVEYEDDKIHYVISHHGQAFNNSFTPLIKLGASVAIGSDIIDKAWKE